MPRPPGGDEASSEAAKGTETTSVAGSWSLRDAGGVPGPIAGEGLAVP